VSQKVKELKKFQFSKNSFKIFLLKKELLTKSMASESDSFFILAGMAAINCSASDKTFWSSVDF